MVLAYYMLVIHCVFMKLYVHFHVLYVTIQAYKHTPSVLWTCLSPEGPEGSHITSLGSKTTPAYNIEPL